MFITAAKQLKSTRFINLQTLLSNASVRWTVIGSIHFKLGE
jgi:hypothetical protein